MQITGVHPALDIFGVLEVVDVKQSFRGSVVHFQLEFSLLVHFFHPSRSPENDSYDCLGVPILNARVQTFPMACPSIFQGTFHTFQ